ncbi:MAG: HD domain-containing protein [Clostridiales bacterium]|nr:HD domain-containing protein [Clostridiales bacterium]
MYADMFQFVKECLEKNDGEATKTCKYPFRKRSEHIKRVFMWAQRLVDGQLSIDREAVLVSAIFHDVGYALSSDGVKHAENSALICEKYLYDKGFDTEFIKFVAFLVKNHSNKPLMTSGDVPLELILLMEADLLDETGALSIIWDCMAEGAKQQQSYNEAYYHILNYSWESMQANPMVTDKAKVIWESKQKLVRDFIMHLAQDLAIGSDNENCRISL